MRIVSLFTFAIFLIAAGLTYSRPAQAQIASPQTVGACKSNDGRPAPGSCQNFVAGQKDVNGKFIGGTEMRYLVRHTIPHGDPFNGGTCAATAGCPALFAFNAYWEDMPGSLEGYGHRCAQALVLTTPVWNGGAWKEDADFGNSEGGACPFSPSTPRGVALATAAAFDKTFTTYGDGSATPGGGISELIVGLWSTLYVPGCRGTPAVVANRVDSSGKWPWTQLACDFAPGGTPSLSQVRSFGSHKDTVTGVDMVFAGENPRGVYSGTLNRDGTIAWSGNPEPINGCTAGVIPQMVEHCTNVVFPGNKYASAQWPSGVSLPRRLTVRVMGITEAADASGNTALYALIGMQVYKRVDGPSPSWSLFWEIPDADRVAKLYGPAMPPISASGLRGFTTIPNPNGPGQALLLAVESPGPAIWRIDINGSGCSASDNACGAIDENIMALTNSTFGCVGCTGYQIPAYNSPMFSINGGVVMGQGSIFYHKGATIPPGHSFWSTDVPGITVGKIDTSAWYSFRSSSGNYTMFRMPTVAGPTASPSNMVSTRSCAMSPWRSIGDDAVYCGGYDAENTPAHNTAWIIRVPLSVFLP